MTNNEYTRVILRAVLEQASVDNIRHALTDTQIYNSVVQHINAAEAQGLMIDPVDAEDCFQAIRNEFEVLGYAGIDALIVSHGEDWESGFPVPTI